MTKRKRK